ncbi:MAG: hypothetical protein KAH32_07085 [Chlamydiia bacterium]|nr:hypothetical protein [Chlamydiia bacterium]
MFETRGSVNRESDSRILEDVLTKAIRLGLCSGTEDDIKELRRILWLSVPTKHPRGNRRYKGWVFSIRSNVLTDVTHIQCTECDDSTRVEVYNECSSCFGEGCKSCKNKGLIRGAIPCPSCAKPKNKHRY